MNVQETAYALFAAKEAMKSVKRNKSGSYSEASLYPVRRRARAALEAAGNSLEEVRDMLKGIGAL
jgi:hypothetical protein